MIIGFYEEVSFTIAFDFWPTPDAHAAYSVQYTFAGGQGGVQFGGAKPTRDSPPTVVCKYFPLS